MKSQRFAILACCLAGLAACGIRSAALQAPTLPAGPSPAGAATAAADSAQSSPDPASPAQPGPAGAKPAPPAPAKPEAPVALGRNGKPVVAAPAALTELAPGSRCPAAMSLIPGGSLAIDPHYPAKRLASHCLDQTEVTVAAYAACVDANACTAPNPYDTQGRDDDLFCNWKHPAGRDTHPINCLDLRQAAEYCRWAARRVPSQLEWEWAARNGDQGHLYPWGPAAPDGTQANGCGKECKANLKAKDLWYNQYPPLYPASDGWPETAPVGSFPKGVNRWGVHDLAGNVAEWTASEDPNNDGMTHGAGGSWSTKEVGYPTLGAQFPPNGGTSCGTQGRNSDRGFRCARDPGP